jgi:prostaglandin-endoperoxide synthase 2
MRARSITSDGAANRLRFLALTNGGPLWDAVQLIKPVHRRLNAALIDHAVREMPARPEPLSTMAPYTSWASLTDRTYNGRHLPPSGIDPARLPAAEECAELFRRGDQMVPCPRSTVLFAYFAQWFTDGFLRGDTGEPRDPRRNSSTHQIDMNQLYGPNEQTASMLREHEGGLLKSQLVNGGEFPPFLCDEKGRKKKEFADLAVVRFERYPLEWRRRLFALGGDRSNLQIGFTMLTVLFLREHNRLAGQLAREYPAWDDERLFQTARNILTLIVCRIVLEEYINHITPYHFRFSLDPTLATRLAKAPWHRENWASFEFSLVYRWHSLIPPTLKVGDEQLPLPATLVNGTLLAQHGLARTMEDASLQRAGRIGLFNTDPALLEVDLASVNESRALRIAPYNDYRRHLKFPPVRSFHQISDDPRVREGLRAAYRSVDDVDLYVGIFAEQPGSAHTLLGPLLTKIIAIDAFSQALTNPLLAPRVLNAETFTPLGLRTVERTRTLSDILHRNSPEDPRPRFISMTRRAR